MQTKRIKITQTIEDSHNYLDAKNKVVRVTNKFYANGGEKGDGVYDMEITRANKLLALGPTYAVEAPGE
jgi:hypothetical protein